MPDRDPAILLEDIRTAIEKIERRRAKGEEQRAKG